MNIRMTGYCLILAILVGCAETLYEDVPLTTRITTTPSATMTLPTHTPTPSPTLTPTPTPTPLPDEVQRLAQRAYHNGDWETAETMYNQLLVYYPLQRHLSTQAMLGLGRVYLATGQFDEALEALDPILTDTFDEETEATAHQIAAEVLMASQQPLKAASHYVILREFFPILETYTYEWEGDAYYAANEFELALGSYESSLVSAESTNFRARLLEKVGLCNAALGVYDSAMAAYDSAEELLTSNKQRARLLYLTVETAQMFADIPEATRRMQRLVADYPEQSYAYQALVQLVENGVPVDDLQRGLVDYYAEAYTPAVQAFARVVNTDAEHDGVPHYYAGLSFLEAGSPSLALHEFEMLIETHPDDAYWGDAVIGKAEALVEMGRVFEATRTIRAFADDYPEHPLAPASLKYASDLMEEDGNVRDAADLLIDLANRYPDNDSAPEARFHAGLLFYQASLLQEAQHAWSDLVVWYPQDDRAQAAHFWLGKTYIQSGEVISATTSFSQAIAINPWNFYGLQAAEREMGLTMFVPQYIFPVPINSPEAQEEAELWLASWLELDPEQPITLSEEVLADLRLQRGRLLLELGYFDAGRAELESLRIAYDSDPLVQYTLAVYYRDIGLYRSSIIAAASVWRQSPSHSLDTLPRFIGGLIYPIYYQDLVEEQAENHNLDPLFAFALLRQESLFEGKATSFAAAHGLMQVIPSTGVAIAQALNWPPNYDTPDLYRPHVSVRFGIWYLTQQLPDVDGSLFAAMAGYNGGPGNAFVWWEASGKDEDLFVELISFRETKLYVRLIREHYAKYLWLYGNQ